MADLDDDDPYGELEPVRGKGKRKAADTSHLLPEASAPDWDIDRLLGAQLLNDYGNAQRFIQRKGEDFFYVRNIGWFAWDGMRFSRELGEALAVKAMHDVARAIFDEADAVEAKPGRAGPEKHHMLRKWAVMSGDRAKINAALATAANYLVREIDALDADPMLIATPNGTLELGEETRFRPSRREDLITRVLAVPFEPSAKCTAFNEFLWTVMPDVEMREYLQRIMGYCLTGLTVEQAIFIFYGTGRNGKSTFVDLMRRIFGDYAMNAPVQMFLARREGNGGGEASPDIARLPGAHFVTASEPPEGARLDESRVKELTGGDRITARHLNQGFFEFDPVFKAVISTNHQPNIRGADEGVWRRIRMLLWKVQIAEEKIDRNLSLKLRAEGPGILQWVLRGVEDWCRMGLKPPASAIAAVEAYRADQDQVGEFIKARCVTAPPNTDVSGDFQWETSAKEFREAYELWCKQEGLEPLKGKTLGSKLTARGIQRRKSNGNTVYVGIVVRALGMMDAEQTA
jgi:putative DNA primase/helicase